MSKPVLYYQTQLRNFACRDPIGMNKKSAPDEAISKPYWLRSAKPYVRWWWLAGPFTRSDIETQLRWVKGQGFGGVEIAWIYPVWDRHARARDVPDWLDDQWQQLVLNAKQIAEELEIGCDLTFGSAWPFGGKAIGPGDDSQTFDGPSLDRLWGAWDDKGQQQYPVLNHLCSRAVRNYATAVAKAFKPILQCGSASALFCDSWELDSRRIWSDELWEGFEQRFGYDLRHYTTGIWLPLEVQYDYLKFMDDVVRKNFYREFTKVSNELGTYSRIQVHGSPTDPVAAYAEADIPETEALLYEPHFSRIASSAAALAHKPIVSCEAFTCIYGFPDLHLGSEDVRDLKLLADALIAEGVNHFVWHGMPYQSAERPQRFYANCHVGPDGSLSQHTRAFNAYLNEVCELMRRGQTYSALAVYLPCEDEIMRGEFELGERRIQGENHRWEMRRVHIPDELAGWNPLWITAPFLAEATVHDEQTIRVGPLAFEAIFVDVEWLERDSLVELVRLSSLGGKIVLKSSPREPGLNRTSSYGQLLKQLVRSAHVLRSINELDAVPLVEGDAIPPYWVRRDDEGCYFFFSHPASRRMTYPMERGQAVVTAGRQERTVMLNVDGSCLKVDLVFDPLQSVSLSVSNSIITDLDIGFERH